LVRSKIDALYLSAKSSIIVACPFSAAKCIGVRSVDTQYINILSVIFQVYLHAFLLVSWIRPRGLFRFIINYKEN
jgi:hypothetical protein